MPTFDQGRWNDHNTRSTATPFDTPSITYYDGFNEIPLRPSFYRQRWHMGGAWYPNFYAWVEDADDLTHGELRSNGTVNMCRAIRDEAYRMDAEWNQAHDIEPLAPWERELLGMDRQPSSDNVGNPNTINEGGTMPETGTIDTIEIEQSAGSRAVIFDRLNLQSSLMSNLDLAHWETVMNQLREATAPVLHAISRGSFEIGTPRTYVGNRAATIEYVSIETAERIIDSASDGKIRLEVWEDRPRYFQLVPNHRLDASAFREYAGDLTIYSDLEGEQRVIYLRDLRSAMNTYADYRAHRRSYLRTAVRTNLRNSILGTPTGELEAPLGFTTERAEKLGEFIKGVQANVKIEANPLSLIPILPHKTISSRRWGIEIEHPDIHGVKTPKHWDLHGDGSLRGRDDYDDDSHDTDCLWYDDEGCDCGYNERMALRGERPNVTGEWNSPILHSFHSRGLKFLMEQLEDRYENDTAGVHVHVEASDLTPEQAVRLSLIYTALEPLFQHEYHREVRNYCKSVDLGEMINRFNAMRDLKGKKSTEFIFHSRYWTVNMAALNAHGTIEFRAMGPVYEYEHLIRWAAFCREMVNIAKADVPQKVWAKVHTFKDLLVVFSKYGKETPTPKWAENEPMDFDEVVTKLGTENRRLPNARPSGAHARYGEAPLEVFDDFYGQVPTREQYEVYNL